MPKGKKVVPSKAKPAPDYARMTKAQLISELESLTKKTTRLKRSDAKIRLQSRLLVESEKRFRHLYERAPLGYQSLDEEGNFKEVNDAWLKTMRYKREEVIGKWFGDFLVGDYRELFRSRFSMFKSLGAVSGVEFEMMRGDGATVIISFDGRIGTDTEGNFLQTHCILQDITGLRAAQMAQAESERRLNDIIESTHAGYFFIDRGGLFQNVNKAWLNMHKYDSPDEIIGKHYKTTQVKTEKKLADKIVESLLVKGEVQTGEFSRRCKDGSVGYHSYTTRPVIKDDRVIGLEGFLIDTTARRASQERLKDSERQYKALVESSPDIIMRFDSEGRHLFVSSNIENLLGKPATSLIGKTHKESGLFTEAQCDFWEGTIAKVFLSGLPSEQEFTFAGKYGNVVFNWRLIPELDDAENVISVLSIARNITRHRQTERNYQLLFDKMQEGFALHEIILNKAGVPVDYRFLSINPAFEKLTGLSAAAIVGKTVLEVMPGTEKFWIETYGKVALTGEPTHFENYSGALGLYFEIVAFSPAMGQFACVFHDITERKEAEARTLKSLKEKEVLLREVHHRVKNNMAVISSLLTLQSHYIKDEKYQDMFTESQNRIKTLAMVHEKLYQTEDFTSIDTEDYISSIARSVSVTFGKNLPVSMSLDIQKIDLDIDFLIPCGLIINELLTNAVKHAFLNTADPQISIAMSMNADSEITFTVADNGQGLPEGFELSTASGLGFKIIEALVIQLEGNLKIQSSRNGSTFSITFPHRPDR